jgi:glycosyltransferase involved in cell wall biosynthesis
MRKALSKPGPIRLTIVGTHPVQYFAPWYRYIAANVPELDLTVVYAARPTAEQQGAGFDRAFEWDRPLEEGYRAVVVRDRVDRATFATGRFRGLDVPEIVPAIVESRPDVVLVPGWHSISLVRAIIACRRRGIPLIYRGDTHLGARPAGARGMAWSLRTRALLHLYAAYLSVGSRSREYLLAHGVPPTAIFASPHAVDHEHFAALAGPHLAPQARRDLRSSLGAGPDDFVVLFAGKLTAGKRPVDAVLAVRALGPGAMLLVAGAGDEERAVRDAAQAAGVRVHALGFVNQTEMPRVYAAADCLVVPSAFESWGLVVNEAMATGLPAVVTESVGCAPDLVGRGTGEVVPAGDVQALGAALARLRDGGARGRMDASCRARARIGGFDAATTGLVAACERLTPRPGAPRVMLCAGGMVVVGGLERMTFEVLRVVRQHGGAVHAIVNSWENHRIAALAETIGASWSSGFYRYAFRRRSRNPLHVLRMGWDVCRTSTGLLRDARRFRPTHVLVPDHTSVLRNAPALVLLRTLGIPVVFRIGNAPERGKFYELLWGRVLPPLVSRFVPNSRFGRDRLQESGVPAAKITLIRNAPSRRLRPRASDADVVALAASRRTILTVGQIAPFKGTHLAVDALLRLLQEGYDVQGVIAGRLPTWPADLVEYADDLQARVQRAGAAARVHFVGAREDVPALMRASYLLAAPILQEETFGNVLLEARYAGLPVVTFARGGLTELVAHGETGIVCDTPDLDGLLQGLRAFLDNPVRRADASRRSLAQNDRPDEDCTPDEFARRWWALFGTAS